MALSGFFQSRICAVMGFCRTNPTSILPPFIFFLCLLTLNLCTPLETITPTQYLKDPETITSSDQIFKLGFFCPINSTNRYVGIWYNKIPSQTVVWVANKENPLTDSSGIFTIGDDGNLVVLDGQNKVLWTTNVSDITYNTSAELLEFGNLVLRDSNNRGRVLWKSLEHPSSTLIPNTRFGTDLKTGEKQVIQSWKSDSDPSHGSFFMELDLTGILQIITWNGSRRYWRSGPWNKRVFIGVHDLHSVYHNGFNAVLDDQERKMYLTLSPASSTSLVRFDLNSQGKFIENDWDEREKRWIESWSAPHTDCEVYGKCGTFGNCNALKSPICSCLRGFVPKSMDEWGKGNWSGGCVRRTQLQCERNNTIGEEVKEDGFLKLKRMKVPDFVSWASAGDLYECENWCLKNCSCTAYSFDNSIGCMWWSGNLIDIATFAKDGVDLYIRLAHSELREKNFKRFIILLVLIGGSIILSALACIFCWLKTKQRGKCRDSPQANFLEDHARGRESLELPLFNFRTIAEATNNFTNKLGEGGFGPVYKGKLLDGPEIAVKRLSRNSGQGIEEFKNELRLISKLQHRNLVRLMGFCIAGEEKILLYEYMAHKSLDAFLFDPTRRVLLDWSKRFSIVDGIARGLLYLHRDSRLRVIHRDLKTSNILLDEDMNPKISDFGMARIFGGKQTLAKTKRVVGTYGYMSPEYAMRGIFSEKSDVFSFGVLLLEIVSGTRNTSLNHNEHSLYLLEYAWRLWNENKALELMDPSLVDTYSPIELMRCIHIGLLCVQEHAIDRPNMSTVVFMLGSETTLPTPKQPAFTVERIQTGSNSPSNTSGMVSINTVTTMSAEGR